MSDEARVFSDLTHWDPIQRVGFAMGWNRGWRPNGESWNIGKDDPYWGQVLERARHAYGDPNIRFNTDERDQPRSLVFGDGTPLPADGTIVYHDADNEQNWIQNADGTVTKANKDFTPIAEPIRPQYQAHPDGGGYVPVDADGRQVGPLADQRPDSALQSTPVSVPAGMTTPQYPQWATDVDPDIPNQMTAVFARLYELFGSGTPARSALPEFPFSTGSGEGSGIDQYDTVRQDFKRIEDEFDSAAKAFKDAVDASANVTEAGRDAISNAIATFNTTAAGLEEGDWDGLLTAEATVLESVTSAVKSAASTAQGVPDNPSGGPAVPAQTAGTPLPGIDSAAASGAPPADPAPSKGGLEDLLSKAAAPFGAGMPMGGNPLGGLGGMNPLGGLGGGSPMGGGGSPLSPLADAAKPLSKLSDTDGKGEDKKPAITPLNPGPQNAPPPPATSPAGAPTDPAAVAAGTPGQPGSAKEPTATPAGNSTTAGAKPTVTLPNGQVIDAPNKQAADAAQNAVDNASPGGDAAQKAYSPTGLELPGDGKNPGAKVDPSDAQAGDVLKWQDKTMVMAAPGLVADPHEPGVTHTLEEVMKDQKGFQGIFRPTETDPTLSMHTSAPPLVDPSPAPEPTEPAPAAPPTESPAPPGPQSPPADPPPDSIELSGPAPGGPGPGVPQSPPAAPLPDDPPVPSTTVPQPAPPSPFEAPTPPATRTTRAQRIAAGDQTS